MSLSKVALQAKFSLDNLPFSLPSLPTKAAAAPAPEPKGRAAATKGRVAAPKRGGRGRAAPAPAPEPVEFTGSAPNNLFGFAGIPSTKLKPTRAVTKGWEGLGNDEWNQKFLNRHGFGAQSKNELVYDDNLTQKERDNLNEGKFISIVGQARNFVPGGAGGRY